MNQFFLNHFLAFLVFLPEWKKHASTPWQDEEKAFEVRHSAWSESPFLLSSDDNSGFHKGNKKVCSLHGDIFRFGFLYRSEVFHNLRKEENCCDAFCNIDEPSHELNPSLFGDFFFDTASYSTFLFDGLNAQSEIKHMCKPNHNQANSAHRHIVHHIKTESHQKCNRANDGKFGFESHFLILCKGLQMLFIKTGTKEPSV